MELKYMWQDWEDSQEESSNRTFMELKSESNSLH